MEISLYQYNQGVMHNIPPLSRRLARAELEKFVNSLNFNETQFLMMLNNDIRYYTLFNCTSESFTKEKLVNDIMSIITDLGELKDCEINEQGGFEFWILFPEIDRVEMLLLFDYTKGVVTV